MKLIQEDLNIILSIIFACLLLYLIIRVMIKPLIYLYKAFYKIIIGITILFLVNATIGTLLQFQLGINPVTAGIAGFLGVPGIILIYGVKTLLG